MMKSKFAKNTTCGFSLLEILFVIVILASAILAWVQYSNTDSTDSLLQKTAEQMQQIALAGRSYFINNDYYWPKDFDELINNDYFPKTAQCSAWQTASLNPICRQHQPFSLYYGNSNYINAKMFGVSLDLPDESLAKRLAALIPLSTRIGNRVTALVTFPAAASDLMGKIIDVGTVRNNQNWPSCKHGSPTKSGKLCPGKHEQNPSGTAENGYVKKPNCPSPLVPVIFFTTYNFTLSYSATEAATGDDLGIDTWCESNDPNDLSTEMSDCYGDHCPYPGTRDYAFSGPQHCDYARDLDPAYWRLNYYSCVNSGSGRDTGGKEGSLIYFTTCLNKDNLTYPGYPYFNQTDINQHINNSGYSKNRAGCYYPTSCTFVNSPTYGIPFEKSGTCSYKRRRANLPKV